MNIDEVVQKDETVDAIPEGRLRIIQKRRGFRFGIDAVLLSHFTRLKRGDRVLDLGTGSGIIALILYHRFPGVSIVGMDIDDAAVAMARRTLILNGIQDEIEFVTGDCRRISDTFPEAAFTAVVMNPPYRRLRSGRINPSPEKARARHEVAGTISDFIAAASQVLAAKGRLFTIYPTSRLVELFHRMRERRIEPKRLQIVHSTQGNQGEFALVEGVKNGREELVVLPPLAIYTEERIYTETVKTIFRELAVFP